MKTFKQYVKEETMPYAGTKSGVIDIRDSAVRDGLNQQLAGVTAGRFITPYIAFERVCKALANFHIFPPRNNFFEGDSGAFNFRIDQFGSKVGMNDDGQVVANPELPYHLYFEYRQSDCGMFMIFCEIVDQDELDEIMDDLEAELNDDTVEDEREDKLEEERQPALPEVGSRKTPGSNQPVITTGVSIPDELESENRDEMKEKLERKDLPEETQLDEVSKKAAIDAYRQRQSRAKDYYSEPDDQKKADKTLNRIKNKFGSRTAKQAERGADIDDNGRKGHNWSQDYLDAKQGVYKKFSRPNSKKGTKERLGYMRMNKGRFTEKDAQLDEVSAGLAQRAAHAAWIKADNNKPPLNKPTKLSPDEFRAKVKKFDVAVSQTKKFASYASKKMVKEEQIDEVSAETVGKVNKARLEKPAKTAAADETRGKAVKKAWLASKVGELKKKD